MPDNNNPTPVAQENGSRLAVVLSILFVVFLTGTLAGFSMCAKSDNASGSYVLGISGAGLILTTLLAFVRFLAFLFDKVDSRLKKKYQPKSDLH